MQNELNSLKEQLQANPNDAEAKNRLAHLEREVENEYKAADKSGDQALKDKLEEVLEGVHNTMTQHGVQQLPKGGQFQAGG